MHDLVTDLEHTLREEIFGPVLVLRRMTLSSRCAARNDSEYRGSPRSVDTRRSRLRPRTVARQQVLRQDAFRHRPSRVRLDGRLTNSSRALGRLLMVRELEALRSVTENPAIHNSRSSRARAPTNRRHPNLVEQD